MSNGTRHTIEDTVGDKENAIKLRITFRYEPGTPANLTVIDAEAVDDDGYDMLPEYLRDMAQDWLDDKGHLAAKDFAERQRGGDYE